MNGCYTFGDCFITECYCNATTFPEIYYNSYYCYYTSFRYGVESSEILYGPNQCGAAYKDSGWGRSFTNIVEMD